MLSHDVEEWFYRHFQAAIFGNDERQVVNHVSLRVSNEVGDVCAPKSAWRG
jgi:hypothetical protein